MLTPLLDKYEIILGSKSPRRQQFLKELNIPFKIITKDVDEIYADDLKANEITEFLAKLKAAAYQLNNHQLLITSDTIVWHNNKALEKPKTKEDAINMIKELSNCTHQVITSVCIHTNHKTEMITDTTLVTFDTLTDDEIEYYVNTFKPFDKAGSYGIQEWIGHIGVVKIEGSYANVVGLPVHKLYQSLKNF